MKYFYFRNFASKQAPIHYLAFHLAFFSVLPMTMLSWGAAVLTVAARLVEDSSLSIAMVESKGLLRDQ